jgi:hypothetical protein
VSVALECVVLTRPYSWEGVLQALVYAVDNADPRRFPFDNREQLKALQVAATELAIALDCYDDVSDVWMPRCA